jgi:hypothetical protein
MGTATRLMTLGGIYNGSSGTRASINLNSAYVHNTSGAGMGFLFMATRAVPITSVYVLLDATTGTRALVSMNGNLYNQGPGLSRPGTTVRASVTGVSLPASDDRWIKFTFAVPYTPTVGEILWFVCNNTAAAPATNFPAINSNQVGLNVERAVNAGSGGFSSTTGFSTNGTAQARAPFFYEHDDGVVCGWPFSLSIATVFANNTRERGLYFPPAPVPYTIGAVQGALSTTGLLTGKVYADGVAPGGATLGTWNWGVDANETNDELMGLKILDTPIDVPANTGIRLVVGFSANNQTPGGWRIEGRADYPAVFDNFFDAGSLIGYGTQDDGAGGWTDSKDFCPSLWFYLNAWPGNAGSSRGFYV